MSRMKNISFSTATQVPMQEFIRDLRFRHLKVWREANFSCPRAVNKKAVTYHKWCGSSESGPRGSPFSIPSYLYKDLDKHVLRNFSRFRLRAHHLRVESCKWHGGSSICDKCECGEVQDEKHVLFFCKCAEVCELPLRYRDLVEGMFKTFCVSSVVHWHCFFSYSLYSDQTFSGSPLPYFWSAFSFSGIQLLSCDSPSVLQT